MKSTGRIDLTRDAELKNAIVHHFEDRQPIIVTLNSVWQDSNQRWLDHAAPYPDVLATDLSQVYPDLRVADAEARAADRRFLFYASDLSGRSLDLRSYVSDVSELNRQLAAQVETQLELR